MKALTVSSLFCLALLSSGCPGGAATPDPEPRFSRTALEFWRVEIHSEKTVLADLELPMEALEAVRITSVGLSDPALPFEIVEGSTCGADSILSPGSHCQIPIRFRPTRTGTYSSDFLQVEWAYLSQPTSVHTLSLPMKGKARLFCAH